jgi:hypothetical protein
MLVLERHTRNDILLRPHQVLHCIFLQVGILLFEVIGERKGDNGKTSVVVGTGVARVIWLFALLVRVVALLPVNIANLDTVRVNRLVDGFRNLRNGTSLYALARDLAVERLQACSPLCFGNR